MLSQFITYLWLFIRFPDTILRDAFVAFMFRCVRGSDFGRRDFTETEEGVEGVDLDGRCSDDDENGGERPDTFVGADLTVGDVVGGGGLSILVCVEK
eukprot:m.66560 g.66560  ORF g.66560 m.66560 type:complete len:97 (-) comp11558_c0_seq1:126-416(-)